MMKNYEHYISRNIQAVYKRRLISPLVYLLLLTILWFTLPLPDLLFPDHLNKLSQISRAYEKGNSYIETTFHNLYFSGYTNNRFGTTNGYYYYTMLDNTCILVLLSPETSEEGLPFIETARVRVHIEYQGDMYNELTNALAKDLSWTSSGFKGKVSPFILSEPGFCSIYGRLLLALYFFSAVYAVITILLYALYIAFPVLSPPCRKLGRFGKASELLAQAEEELATLPQLATEDMFITEHYFIEIAPSGIAIVPIQEMIWIYKYSTLHKFLWHHFNISYTLHITTNRHLHIQCPKNMKSDIDGIIDYLSEANHDTLVGFSEENRLKVREMQGGFFNFENIIKILKRRF